MATPAVAAPPMSADDFLILGLELGGHDKWRSYKHHCNIDRFKEDYGIIPQTAHLVWDALRTASLIDNNSKPKHFMIAIRFLWKYEDESDLKRFFKLTEKTVRKWWKHYVFRIEQLLDAMVCYCLVATVAFPTKEYSNVVSF